MGARQDDNEMSSGYSLAFASALILSTTGILVRHLTGDYHLPPMVLAFWRNAFLTLFLLVLLELFYPFLVELKRRDLGYMAAYGLVLAAFNLFWTTSVAMNGAAVATLLVYSSAGFAALLGWQLLNEALGPAKILAVGLCLAGCTMVSGFLGTETRWAGNAAGILTGILSGLSYAFYSLMGRSACNRGIHPWTILLYTFGFAAIFLLIFNLLSMDIVPWGKAKVADLLWLGSAVDGWFFLILLAIGPTLIGFGLYSMSLEYLPSSTANLIATTEPIFTALLAFLLLGEVLGPVQLGGGLCILGGVLVLRFHELRRLAVTVGE